MDAVGVNPVDLSAIDDFALYPNPTDKELKIAAKNLPYGSTLHIMNYAGILIHSIELKENSIQTIDVSSFNNGLYLYNVYSNGKIIAKGKFNIVH